jgi:hypothetical protein
MNRRTFLEVAGIGAGLAMLGSSGAAQTMDGLAGTMAQAAQRFLGTLSANDRSRASFAFSSTERTRWHWTTPAAVPRNGLALRDMGDASRAAALALLRSSLSATGYEQAVKIIALQLELGQDDGLYYVSVFGAPGVTSAGAWGWRFEGHHLSKHFMVAGTRVTTTPFFTGAWPTQPASVARAMPREEDAARELLRSMNADQRKTAIFQSDSLTQHVTQNAMRVAALPAVGIALSSLSAAQQNLMLEVIGAYLGTLPEAVAQPMLTVAKREFAASRVGWAGSLEPRQPHYYRWQSASYLLEFDNSRNGGTHIHSVWREFAGDFGGL